MSYRCLVEHFFIFVQVTPTHNLLFICHCYTQASEPWLVREQWSPQRLQPSPAGFAHTRQGKAACVLVSHSLTLKPSVASGPERVDLLYRVDVAHLSLTEEFTVLRLRDLKVADTLLFYWDHIRTYVIPFCVCPLCADSVTSSWIRHPKTRGGRGSFA